MRCLRILKFPNMLIKDSSSLWRFTQNLLFFLHWEIFELENWESDCSLSKLFEKRKRSGRHCKGRILVTGIRDKIYDFPTDSSANSAPPQSPLLQRLKHAWIGEVVSFLLFSASSQRKTSILLFDSCSPETAMKDPLLPWVEDSIWGAAGQEGELQGVCASSVGVRMIFPRVRLAGLEPRVNHSSTLNCTTK